MTGSDAIFFFIAFVYYSTEVRDARFFKSDRCADVADDGASFAGAAEAAAAAGCCRSSTT